MKYIDRDVLIEEIFNEMRTYKDLGNIDESFIYKPIDLCLYKLNIKTKTCKTAMLNVDRFKAELPIDFGKLKHVLRCSSARVTYTLPTRQSEEINTKYVDGLESTQRYSWQGMPSPNKCLDAFLGKHDCNTACGTNCDYGDGNYFIRNIFNDLSYDITNIRPLILSANDLRFSKKHSQDIITIENGFINTCFQEGVIFVEYESTQNDYLIPDNEEIRKAIKDIVKHELFQTMFYNGEVDVQQRLQYSERFAMIGYTILKKYSSTYEVSEFYGMRGSLINRFNILNNLTKGHYSIIRRF